MLLKLKNIALDIPGYSIAAGTIALSFDDAVNMACRLGALVLLGLQIYHTRIKIRKEKRTP